MDPKGIDPRHLRGARQIPRQWLAAALAALALVAAGVGGPATADTTPCSPTDGTTPPSTSENDGHSAQPDTSAAATCAAQLAETAPPPPRLEPAAPVAPTAEAPSPPPAAVPVESPSPTATTPATPPARPADTPATPPAPAATPGSQPATLPAQVGPQRPVLLPEPPSAAASHIGSALRPQHGDATERTTRRRRHSAAQPRAAAGRQRAASRRKRSGRAAGTNAGSHRTVAPIVYGSVSAGPSQLLALPALPEGLVASFPGPDALLPVYEAAAAQYDVPWQLLAAIDEAQSGYGARRGQLGRMGFRRSEWVRWGVDANGDGMDDADDAVDAIFAVARLLHAIGSVEHVREALQAAGDDGSYAARIVERASVIGSIDQGVLTALSNHGRKQSAAIRRLTGRSGYLASDADINTIGRAILADDATLRDHLLASPNVQIYPCGRQDIAAGVIDRRILQVLEYLAFNRLDPYVTSLRCGHGFYTASGNVSEHSSGDAVDIAMVDGTPILGHQGPGTVTERALEALARLGGMMRPHQIISLMTVQGASNTLALSDHADHIHVGFQPARAIAGG